MELNLHFDEDSGVPLYRQLSDYLQELIRTGRFGRGDRLPALREVATQLRLNRTTVAAAYERLEEGGLIRTEIGRGTFVAGLPEPQRPTVPDQINFAASRPSEDLFPISEFRAACQEVLSGPELRSLLQLGAPRGYEPLRSWLLCRARQQNVAGPGDDILITNGCQQAIDLLRRALVRPGSKVALEEPVYPGLRNLFTESGAELIGVDVSKDGMDPASLRRALEAGAKLVLITPSFQNPTGATIPNENRERIIEMTRAAGATVIENDIYSELLYQGAELPRLKSLDGNVILLGSFSKIAFPGMRCGWILAPKQIIARVAELKQLADLHTDQLSQAFLLRFAESGRLAAHQERAVAAGRERLDALADACSRYLPADCRYEMTRGGMNMWIDLPEGVDASALRGLAQQVGIDYLPGRYFSITKPFDSSLRLSFAGVDVTGISRGVERLGALIRAATITRDEASRPTLALV